MMNQVMGQDVNPDDYPLWNDRPVSEWVKNRGNCTTTLGFRGLANIVERDVDHANQLPEPIRGPYRFIFERNGQVREPVFRVTRRTEGHPEKLNWPSVMFVQKSTCIEISGHGHPNPILVVPTWDAENHCCLWWINKVHYALWQISQEALGDFFFTQ